MKKAFLTLVILGAFGGGGYAYYNYRKRAEAHPLKIGAEK